MAAAAAVGCPAPCSAATLAAARIAAGIPSQTLRLGYVPGLPFKETNGHQNHYPHTAMISCAPVSTNWAPWSGMQRQVRRP